MVSKDTLRGVIQVLNKVDGSTFTEAELAPRPDPRRPRRDRHRERLALPPGVPGLDHRRPHRARQHAPLPRESRRRDGARRAAVADCPGPRPLQGRRRPLRPPRGLARHRADRPADRPPGAAGRRRRALRRRRVRRRAPRYRRPGGARLAESIREAIEACRQMEGEDVDLSRVTASVGRRLLSGRTPPMRRACSGARTTPCTRRSARAGTGSPSRRGRARRPLRDPPVPDHARYAFPGVRA